MVNKYSYTSLSLSISLSLSLSLSNLLFFFFSQVSLYPYVSNMLYKFHVVLLNILSTTVYKSLVQGRW